MTQLKQRWLVACFIVFTAATGTKLDAQGLRGRGRGGRRLVGTIEHIVVHGKALEGNLEGDSPDREVTVYLPPSYATDQMRRFPVVYLLHDFGAREDMFTGGSANLPGSADRLAGAQGFSEPIVVMPSAFTLHGGSMYSNSVTTGDWETFIAQDLVTYIDGHYRTIAARISRGLAGHSMGGYGALRIGMKRPDVFSSLYIMSAASLSPNQDLPPEAIAGAEAVKTRAQAEQAVRAGEGQPVGLRASLVLASAAAWSPDADNPPLYLDLPVQGGKSQAEILTRWAANAGLTMLENYGSNLKKYYGIAIDVGLDDPLMASNRQLHEAMMRLGIPHSYEEYKGDHTNMLGERIERNLLPFFSRNLAAPANPTSPSVQD